MGGRQGDWGEVDAGASLCLALPLPAPRLMFSLMYGRLPIPPLPRGFAKKDSSSPIVRVYMGLSERLCLTRAFLSYTSHMTYPFRRPPSLSQIHSIPILMSMSHEPNRLSRNFASNDHTPPPSIPLDLPDSIFLHPSLSVSPSHHIIHHSRPLFSPRPKRTGTASAALCVPVPPMRRSSSDPPPFTGRSIAAHW